MNNKLNRNYSTGVSLSKTQLDIETQFKNIQDTQQNLYNNLKLLINTIFESYKKNNYKNDNRIKLLSSFLLLRNISDKNIGFTKLIVEQKENVQSYINKIVKDILSTKIESDDFDLSDINSQYSINSIEKLTEQQEKDINDDIFNIYQDIIGEFSKEIQNTLKTINEKDDNSEKQKTSFNIYKGKKQKKRQAKKQNKKYNEFLKDHIKIDQKISEKIALRLFSNFIGIIEKNQNILEKTSNQLQNSGINTIFSNNKNDIKNSQYDKLEKKQINTYKKLINRLKKSNFIRRKYQNSINVRLRKLRARMWLISKRNTGKISLFSKMLIKPLGIASKFVGIFGVVGGVLGTIISSSAKIVGKTLGWIGSKVKGLTSFVISSVSNMIKQISKPLIPLFIGFLMTPQGAYMMGFLYGTIFKKLQKNGNKVANILSYTAKIIGGKLLKINKEIEEWNTKLAHILINLDFGHTAKIFIHAIHELLNSCTPMGMVKNAGMYLAGAAVSSIGMGLARMAIGKSAGGLIGALGSIGPHGWAAIGIITAITAAGYGIYKFIDSVKKSKNKKIYGPLQKLTSKRKITYSKFEQSIDSGKRTFKNLKFLKTTGQVFLKFRSSNDSDEKRNILNILKSNFLKIDIEKRGNDERVKDFVYKKLKELDSEKDELYELIKRDDYAKIKYDLSYPKIDLMINGINAKNLSLQGIFGDKYEDYFKMRFQNLLFHQNILERMLLTDDYSVFDTENNKYKSFDEKLTDFYTDSIKKYEFTYNDKNELSQSGDLKYDFIFNFVDGSNKQQLVSNFATPISISFDMLQDRIKTQPMKSEINIFSEHNKYYNDRGMVDILINMFFDKNNKSSYETDLKVQDLFFSVLQSKRFMSCVKKKNINQYNFLNSIFSDAHKSKKIKAMFILLLNDEKFNDQFISYFNPHLLNSYGYPLEKSKIGSLILARPGKLKCSMNQIPLFQILDKQRAGKFYITKITDIEIEYQSYRGQKLITDNRVITLIVDNETKKIQDGIMDGISDNIYQLINVPLQIFIENEKLIENSLKYSDETVKRSGTVTGIMLENVQQMGNVLKEFMGENIYGEYIDADFERQQNEQMVRELKRRVENAADKISKKRETLSERKNSATNEKEYIEKQSNGESKTEASTSVLKAEKPKFSSSTQRENRARLFNVQQNTRV